MNQGQDERVNEIVGKIFWRARGCATYAENVSKFRENPVTSCDAKVLTTIQWHDDCIQGNMLVIL